jgi:hypothetical protein
MTEGKSFLQVLFGEDFKILGKKNRTMVLHKNTFDVG